MQEAIEVGEGGQRRGSPNIRQEGGGRGMQEAIEVWEARPRERKPETIQEGGGRGGYRGRR